MILGLELWEIALLGATVFVAGTVRGFSGFGGALIYLPVAGQVLPPFAVLTTVILFDMIAPLPNLPRALRDGARGDIARLVAGLLLFLPLGLYVLTLVPPEAFRWAVSLLSLGLLVCLVGGFRYRGRLTPPLVFGTGGLSGFLCGAAGLPGPPAILLYMAAELPPKVIRGTLMVFLMCADLALLGMLWVFGRLEPDAVLVGLGLILPALLGNLFGARIFRPEAEKTYRVVAYAIIAASALSGLPLWD